MAWFKRSSRLTILATILAVALTLGLAANVPAQVPASSNPDSISNQLPNQWNFTPPKSPGEAQPINRESGGSRDGNKGQCIPIDQKFFALVPPSGIGETAAEYPTVFWYMPQTSASELEFVLQDANQQLIYSAKYALAKSADGWVVGSPGIMNLSLPVFASLPPLKIGQEYQWLLGLICQPIDRSNDVFVGGWIRRVAPNSTLISRIQQATLNERLGLYAQNKLWYETLATLDELKRNGSNSEEVADAWNKLLNSVGLQIISQAHGNSR